MSAEIRKAIALRTGSFQKVLHNAQSFIANATPLPNDRNEQENYMATAKSWINQIKRNARYITELDTKWTDLIYEIEDKKEKREEDLKHETASYGPKSDGYMHQIVNAEDVEMQLDTIVEKCAIRLKHIEHLEERELRVNGQVRQNFVGEQVADANNFNQNQNDQNTAKLEKLKLETFDGNPRQFRAFWDSFQAGVHRNANLTDSQKFQYLRNVLYKDAKAMIDGIEVTDANYLKALKLLQNRFGNKGLIVTALYSDLRQISLKSSEIKMVRKFVDSVEKVLNQLDSEQEPTESQILVQEILCKLPEDMRIKIEEKRASQAVVEEENDQGDQDNANRNENFWTMKSLRKSLQSYVSIREIAQFQTSHQPDEGQLVTKQTWNRDPFRKNFGFKNRPTLNAMCSDSEKDKDKKVKCSFCERPHYSDQCKTYPDVNSRRERFAQLKLCYKCSRSGHRSQDCRKFVSCYFCKQNGHQGAFCHQKFRNQDTAKYENSQVKARNLSSTAHVKENCVSEYDLASSSQRQTVQNEMNSHAEVDEFLSNEKVIMMTATTEIRNPTSLKTLEVRMLLDTASTKSFMSHSLARKLNLKMESSGAITVDTFGSTKPLNISTKLVETEILLREKKNKWMPVKLIAVETVTGKMTRNPVEINKLPFKIPKRDLADMYPNTPMTSTVDLLIGMDYFNDLMKSEPRQKIQHGLYLYPSKLGWIFSGKVIDETAPSKENVYLNIIGKSMKDEPVHINTEVNQQLFELRRTSCTGRMQNIKPNLEDMSSLETIGIKDSPFDADDEVAQELFNQSIFQLSDGRYEVGLPKKPNVSELPENKGLALGRLNMYCNKSEEIRKRCDAIIQDQIQKEIIEEVTEEEKNSFLCHYIPHHPVITPQKTTTKIRIVYDGSAKPNVKKPSLNEILYKGPTILPDLVGMLIRFRTYKFPLLADVEKAFLQIGIHKKDRDLSRFFWFTDPLKKTLQDNIKIYRFCRVMFGLNTSPFLLAATIAHHLDKYGTNLSEMIKKNIYVDNVVIGTQSTDEGQKMYSEAKQIFAAAKLNLREWISNDTNLMNLIPEIDRMKADNVKVLGVKWNIEDDKLLICGDPEISNLNVLTKRNLLHSIAKVFDPLGLLSPIMLNLRLVLQDLWRRGYDWDAQFDEEMQEKIKKVMQDVGKIAQEGISRYLGEGEKYEIHCFCDASKDAFATAVYLKITNSNQNSPASTVNLVFAKSRLAPLNRNRNGRKNSKTMKSDEIVEEKRLTVPRMELLAILIGVRAIDFVAKQLHLEINQRALWTDSQIAMSWIGSHCGKLGVFIDNRLLEIRENMPECISYINTSENPADLATKRNSFAEFEKRSDLWWHGPGWLKEDPNKWPSYDVPLTKISKESINAKKENMKLEMTSAKHPLYAVGSSYGRESNDVVSLEESVPSEKNQIRKELSEELNIDLQRNEEFVCLNFHELNVKFRLTPDKFSSLNRLHRVTAWCLRFFKNIKAKLNCKKPTPGSILSIDELQEAKLLWEKYIQGIHYKEELKLLNSGKKNQFMKQLGLVLDENKLVRCKGRFENAKLPREVREPKLMPPKEPYTDLIILNNHCKVFHMGVSQTLASIRQEHWIPRGRSEVARVLRSCGICLKASGGPYKPPNMPSWPEKKMEKSNPFAYTGIDYFGPLYVRSPIKENKVWIALFTCLTTRAIHLQIADDKTTEQFLLCLRKFISRFGKPDEVISDNASQFKLANKSMGNMWKNVKKIPDVQNYVANQGIRWKFIPELSPWMGGFYERMISTVKSCLKKVIGRKALKRTELETLLCEVETIVNKRPLTYVGDDFDDRFTISPSDFLSLNPKLGVPEFNYDKTNFNHKNISTSEKILQAFKEGQKKLNTFWNLWQNEYLLSLRERKQFELRHIRGSTNANPQIGDIVLIKELLPRGCWKMGRIYEMIYSNDGEVRAARVKLPNGKLLLRAIRLLYPIESTKDPKNK